MGVARHRARPAAVAAVAVLLAACASPADGPGGEGGDTSGAASDSSGAATDGPATEAAPVSYERPTVDPPGELTASIVGDDLLLVGPETLPDELIAEVEAIRVGGKRAVTDTAQFALTQIPVENRVLDVAAVDIPSYRRFTEQQSAEHQEQWDRVADGEMAVSDELKERLPVDEEGYVALATGDTTHQVHVASYYPQVGTVDAVVNSGWGEELDMVPGNALVIHTGTYSPQAVHRRLAKILEKDTSVYELDAVAEYGLDPDAVQTVSFVGSFAEAVGTFRYEVIGGGRIQPDPAWEASHITTETMPIIGSMKCNKHMMPQLRAALLEIQQAGLADKINPGEYAGCYYPRFIAGSTTLSNHSYGLAFDINVPGNQRGTVGEIDRVVVAIFKKWGFAWGGDWSWTDPMHFELARIVRPKSD